MSFCRKNQFSSRIFQKWGAPALPPPFPLPMLCSNFRRKEGASVSLSNAKASGRIEFRRTFIFLHFGIELFVDDDNPFDNLWGRTSKSGFLLPGTMMDAVEDLLVEFQMFPGDYSLVDNIDFSHSNFDNEMCAGDAFHSANRSCDQSPLQSLSYEIQCNEADHRSLRISNKRVSLWARFLEQCVKVWEYRFNVVEVDNHCHKRQRCDRLVSRDTDLYNDDRLTFEDRVLCPPCNTASVILEGEGVGRAVQLTLMSAEMSAHERFPLALAVSVSAKTAHARRERERETLPLRWALMSVSYIVCFQFVIKTTSNFKLAVSHRS